MKDLLKILCFIAMFSFGFLTTEAKGREVTIFLKDSTEVKGELLSVRDSLLAVAVERISLDEDIAAYPERVRVLAFKNIENITIETNNYVIQGGLTGLGLGAGSAILVNQGGGFFRKGGVTESGWVNSVQFLLQTTLIGMGIGSLLSDNEETFLFSPATHDSTEVHHGKDGYMFFISCHEAKMLLKQHARFEFSEPHHLRDIINEQYRNPTQSE
ncbi:MAG TPA: hypothetical protein VEC36_06310 [Patescibacteria group bacterium]|nr:hypothetical protein [Patescibacteria group bacterium]